MLSTDNHSHIDTKEIPRTPSADLYEARRSDEMGSASHGTASLEDLTGSVEFERQSEWDVLALETSS